MSNSVINKKFNYYLVIWAIMLVLFIIAAVVAALLFDIDTWNYAIGATGVMVAFFGELALARKVFRQEDLQKFFYNVPILKIIKGSLYVMTVVGIACMVIPVIPMWAAAAACLLIVAATAIALTRASAAASIVGDIDDKVAESTRLMKQFRAKAASLLEVAQNSEAKTAVKGVEELLRYADPVASPASAACDAQIAVRLEDLQDLLKQQADNEAVQDICKKIADLVKERNEAIIRTKH